MKRLLAVVEGRSEELYLKQVLAPHLAEHGVSLEPMLVLRGGGARGGGRSWQPWRRHLQGLLQSQPAAAHVTTLLDLYAIPRDTPGALPEGPDGASRADRVLAAIAADIGHPHRFTPYVQVHEFEALLLSEPVRLAEVAPASVDYAVLAALGALAASIGPEGVDEGPQTAPSKRLAEVCAGFHKLEHGVQALVRIPLATVRAACPRFHGWVTSLERLGQPP